jgi:hypothetical protein
MFNRISERYDGEVMARVIQVHPRHPEYLCEGCNMSLAAERANALLTRDDYVHCGAFYRRVPEHGSAGRPSTSTAGRGNPGPAGPAS